MNKSSFTTNKEILAGIFNNEESASKALIDLKKSGYSPEEINVVMSKETKIQLFGNADHSFYFGLKNGHLNLWISDTGMVGSGPMLATLNESGFLSQTTGVRAALIGAGISLEQARRCNEGLKNGKILLTVNPKTEDDLEYISYKWNQYRAEEVYS
jgi:hypothetical protein